MCLAAAKSTDDHFWNSVLRQALLHNLIIKDIENYGVIKLSDKEENFWRSRISIMISSIMILTISMIQSRRRTALLIHS
jgi:hypothetical protein